VSEILAVIISRYQLPKEKIEYLQLRIALDLRKVASQVITSSAKKRGEVKSLTPPLWQKQLRCQNTVLPLGGVQ
jgi:hypothetical protein